MSTPARCDSPMDTEPTRPRSVLVVDDDTVSRLVLAHMVRRLGYDVVEADDLQPALTLAGATDFQLIISDYAMPGGTGLQLLADLPPDKRPSFVLVTGIAPDAVSGSASAAHASAARASAVHASAADASAVHPSAVHASPADASPADASPADASAADAAADAATAGHRRFEVPAGRSIDGYLTKPVSTRAVRACLRSVLTARDH